MWHSVIHHFNKFKKENNSHGTPGLPGPQCENQVHYCLVLILGSFWCSTKQHAKYLRDMEPENYIPSKHLDMTWQTFRQRVHNSLGQSMRSEGHRGPPENVLIGKFQHMFMLFWVPSFSKCSKHNSVSTVIIWRIIPSRVLHVSAKMHSPTAQQSHHFYCHICMYKQA